MLALYRVRDLSVEREAATEAAARGVAAGVCVCVSVCVCMQHDRHHTSAEVQYGVGSCVFIVSIIALLRVHVFLRVCLYLSASL
jgi:hypothetical protein